MRIYIYLIDPLLQAKCLGDLTGCGLLSSLATSASLVATALVVVARQFYPKINGWCFFWVWKFR